MGYFGTLGVTQLSIIPFACGLWAGCPSVIDILRHRPEKKVHSHKAIPFFWNLLRKRMVATLMLHCGAFEGQAAEGPMHHILPALYGLRFW